MYINNHRNNGGQHVHQKQIGEVPSLHPPSIRMVISDSALCTSTKSGSGPRRSDTSNEHLRVVHVPDDADR